MLQKIAKDILVIHISTVASESTFSTSGRLVSLHRSRLHPNTLEALMCGQNWLLKGIKGNKCTQMKFNSIELITFFSLLDIVCYFVGKFSQKK